MSQCSVHHKKTKASLKRNHFDEFDQMIRDKYDTRDNKFESMSYADRNAELKKMLENENIIVFPEGNAQPEDGLPLF